MKVNVDQTVEISDEDRKKIAENLGIKHATRDDLKAFLWQHGAGWRTVIDPFEVDATNVNGVGDDEPEEEDLLGDALGEAEAGAGEDLLGDDEDLI